jgi:integrase/recombinase XerD
MAGRRAKILSPADVNDLLLFASCTRNPLRNRVIVLLSAKAGLRAGEIANLTWDMVLDSSGQIGCVRTARPCGQEGQRSRDPYSSGAASGSRCVAPSFSGIGICR